MAAIPHMCSDKGQILKLPSTNGLPLEYPELFDHRSERRFEACNRALLWLVRTVPLS